MAVPYILYSFLHNCLPNVLPDYTAMYQSVTGITPMIRALYFHEKFFNQSSFPTVICLFCLAFYLNNRYPDTKKLKIHFCEFIIYLLLGLYNPIGLFVFNLWAFNHSITLLNLSELKVSIIRIIKRYFLLIVANCLILPYAHYLTKHVGGELFVGFVLSRSLTLNGNVFIILLFIAISALFVFRTKKQLAPRFICYYRFLFLSILCTNLINLPAKNEYKIVQLSLRTRSQIRIFIFSTFF